MRYGVIVVATLLAAGCSDNGGGAAAGEEGGACYPNDTCNAGLVCLSHLCVNPGGSPDASLTDAALPDGGLPDAGGIVSPETEQTLLCLNGTSSHGQTLAQTGLATLTSATVELWARSADPTGERQLFVFHPDDLNAARGVTLSVVDASAQNFGPLTGRILFVAVDGRDSGGALNARGFQLPAQFQETLWHHYAVVFTGTTQRAFVDGIELTTVKQRDGAANTSFADSFGAAFANGGGKVYMALGWFPRNASRFFSGYIEDVRISSVARYDATFTPAYPLAADANTLAFYPIDEGTGATSADSTAGHADVTWTGAAWGSCTSNFALAFDGIDDVLSSSTALGLGLSSSVTAEFWLRPSAIGPWMKLLNIHNSADRDVDMELRPDGHIYCTLFDQQPVGTPGLNHGVKSTTTLVANTWYHVACSYDGSTQRLFINGTLEATNTWTGQIQLNDVVTISGFESRYVQAEIDEFKLDTTALYKASFTPPAHLTAGASTQVLWLFDEGSGQVSADSSGHGRHAKLGIGPGAGGPPSWLVANR